MHEKENMLWNPLENPIFWTISTIFGYVKENAFLNPLQNPIFWILSNIFVYMKRECVLESSAESNFLHPISTIFG